MKRRDFIKLSGMVAGASLIPVYQVEAADAVHLSVDDPQAKALAYTEMSAVKDSHCANCAQSHGDAGAEWLGCNIFPGKEVKATGWCKVWSARPA